MSQSQSELEDDLDALFKLPLEEFVGARNALAVRLKKSGNRQDADLVKALAKPSVSAWAVNQLYWNHGEAFEELIAASQRFGKTTDIRDLLAARRDALSNLARLAATLLRDRGHNATPEMMRRITATLEAVSASSALSDPPRLGRLTEDIDPPGFDSMAGLIPSVVREQSPKESTRVVPFPSKRDEKAAKIAAAEQALQKTRSLADEASAVLERATAHADLTERARREAEERFQKATLTAREAQERLQRAAADVERIATEVEAAERAFERARTE